MTTNEFDKLILFLRKLPSEKEGMTYLSDRILKVVSYENQTYLIPKNENDREFDFIYTGLVINDNESAPYSKKFDVEVIPFRFQKFIFLPHDLKNPAFLESNTHYINKSFYVLGEKINSNDFDQHPKVQLYRKKENLRKKIDSL